MTAPYPFDLTINGTRYRMNITPAKREEVHMIHDELEGYHIIDGPNGPHVVCRAENNEILNSSEVLSSNANAENNICASLRMSLRDFLSLAERVGLSAALETINGTPNDFARLIAVVEHARL